MTTAVQTMVTAEDLWQMPGNGRGYQLSRGELIMVAPAGGGHGDVAYTVGFLLGMHVRANRLGKMVAAETGFVISRNPDTVRAPDAAFIAKAKIPAEGLPAGYIPFAPDIAVEVLSPSDTQIAVEEKTQQWLDAGTAMVWVVNPRRKTVTVHRAACDPRVLHEGDLLRGDEVCPCFEVKVAELFDGT